MNKDSIEVSVIDVHVATLRQLFNEMDPSPFQERDLNPHTEEYIVSWSRELPRHSALSLRLHVDHPSGQEDDGAAVGAAIRRFFKERSSATRLRLRRLFANGRIALVIGLVFLTVALSMSRLLNTFGEPGGFAGIIKESLLVGGWVAMWRPIEVFLYDWWPISAEARLFDRLAAMPVQISYS